MSRREKGAAQPVAPARSRSGKHVSPRVNFHAPAAEIARWRADAEREGLTLTEWLIEAARAYARMDQHGQLSDQDWREVVSG